MVFWGDQRATWVSCHEEHVDSPCLSSRGSSTWRLDIEKGTGYKRVKSYMALALKWDIKQGFKRQFKMK